MQLSADAAGDKVPVRMVSAAELKKNNARGAAAPDDAPGAKRQKGPGGEAAGTAGINALAADAQVKKPGEWVRVSGLGVGE